MYTQALHLTNIEADHTICSNGITLISSEAFATEARRRVYQVYIAGGRLADDRALGVARAFQQAYLQHCDRSLAGIVSIGALAGETQDAYLSFQYVHHGMDNKDAICLRCLMQELMNAHLFHPSDPDQIKEHTSDEVDRFWVWFYKQTMPSWERMHVSRTNEQALANVCDPSALKKFRTRLIHPHNMLVINSDPGRHAEITSHLMQFPHEEGEVFDWRKKLAPVDFIEAEYPDGPYRMRRPAHSMIYIPLPDTWDGYFLTILLLLVCYSEYGMLSKMAFERDLEFDVRLTTVFTPQPMAYLFIKANKRDLRKAVELIKIAPGLLLNQWSRKTLHAVNRFLPESMLNHATPQRMFIESWLAREKVEADLFTKDKNEALRWLLQTYLNESRFGRIDRIPQSVSQL